MAEYIGRANVVGKLTSSEVQRAMRELDGSQAYSFFLSLLNEEPAIDAVPVVRCKDCKRFFEYHPTYRRNGVEGADGDCLDRIINSDNRQFQGVKYSDFCSYGERKDGEG